MVISRLSKSIFGALLVSLIAVLPASAASVISIDDPLRDQWAYERVKIEHAWNLATGSRDVVVAVIDNGFDRTHKDLADNVWQNVDEIPGNNRDDDNNGYIDDVWGWSFVPRFEGDPIGSNNPHPQVRGLSQEIIDSFTAHHGTAVAGLIGAVGGDGLGMSGIAPRVSLMNLQLVDESGSGTFERLADAIRYAVDNGAHVINMSIVGETKEDVREAVLYAYDHGVVLIAAAGNNYQNLNENPTYPVCADTGEQVQKVLGVSAIDIDRQISAFSNIGSACIDITAPGSDMTSTAVYAPAYGFADQYLSGWSGTSFGAPLVSGVAALIKSIRPMWSPDAVYQTLLSTISHTPGQDEFSYANLFGRGLLRADRAVRYALGRRAGSIVHFSHDSGASSMQSMQDEQDEENPSAAVLAGTDDVISYVNNNVGEHATLLRENGTATLTRYNDAWNPVYAFQFPAEGPLAFTVLAEDEPRFVITPQYASDVLFWIYTGDGILLHERKIDTPHTGASVDHLLGRGFVSMSSDGATGTVRVFTDIYGEPDTSFDILDVSGISDVAAVDLDDDGVDEFVIGGARDESPVVYYYESTGKQLRKFFVYGAYTGGFSLQALDYDEDKKDDILITPRSSDQPVRVWSGRGKKLLETYYTSLATTQGMATTVIPQ